MIIHLNDNNNNIIHLHDNNNMIINNEILGNNNC